MVKRFSDTSSEAAALLHVLLRRSTPARKMVMLAQMNQTVIALSLSGLRSRFPEDTDEKIRRRLANLILGDDLATKVYGPLEGKDGISS